MLCTAENRNEEHRIFNLENLGGIFFQTESSPNTLRKMELKHKRFSETSDSNLKF